MIDANHIADKLHVLLIDESKSTSQLCNLLNEQGYCARQVKSLDALGEHLDSFPEYNVILVERDLPKVQGDQPRPIGFELFKQLKKRYADAQVRLYTSGDEAIFRQESGTISEWIDRSRNLVEIANDVSMAGVRAMRDKLKSSQTLARHINSIAHSLINGSNESEVYRLIVNGVAATGFDRVRLAIRTFQSGRFKIVAHFGHKSDAAVQGLDWVNGVSDFDLADPKPKLIPHSDVVTERFFKVQSVPIMPLQRIELPLVVDGQLLGIISADTMLSKRQILQEELEPLMGIAAQAAVALSKLKLHRSEAEHALMQKTVVDISLEIGRLETSDQIYHAVSKNLVDLFPSADHSGLVIFDPDHGFGTVVAEYPERNMLGTRIPLKGNQFEEILLNGAPYIEAYDVAADTRTGEVGAILDTLNIQSVLIVPIRHEGHLLGSLSLDAIYQQHQFNDHEIELLQIFAASVGAALSNAERLEKLSLLSQAATAIGAKIERKAHLEEIVALAIKLLKARSGGIALIDRDRQGLKIIIDSQRMLKHDAFLPYGEGMAGYLIEHKFPHLITEDYSQEPYRAEIFQESQPFGAMIQVPLYWGDDAIGVLYVDDKAGRRFHRRDVDDLQLFASYVTNIINLTNLLEHREQLINVLAALHEIGDSIEAADSIERILHYALFGVTSTYALNFDQASIFLFKDPIILDCLEGRAAYGHLAAHDHAAEAVKLMEAGIVTPNTHMVHYEANGFPANDLDAQVRGTQVNLLSDNGGRLREWITTVSKQANSHVIVQPDINLLPQPLQMLVAEDAPFALVALLSKKKRIGLLLVQNPHSKRAIELHHKLALRTFATSTAVAIDKVRLINQAMQDATRLSSLYELGNTRFGKRGDREQTMRNIVSTLMRAAGSDGATFIRIDPDTSEVTNVVAVGLYEEIKFTLGEVRPKGQSMAVIKSGNAFFVENTARTQVELNKSVKQCNYGAVVCLPAYAIDEALGVIWLGYREPQQLNREMLNAWQLFVNHAALTYRLASDKQRLDAERNMTQQATEMVALRAGREMYERIVRGIRGLLQAAGVRLYLFDDRRKTIITKFESTQKGECLERSIDTDEHQQATRLLTQPPATYFITKATVDIKAHRALISSSSSGSAFIAPLQLEGEKFGILSVAYQTAQHFSKSQKASLNRLQTFCAVTLHNHGRLTKEDHQVVRLNTLNKISRLKNSVQSLPELFDLITCTIFEAFEKQNRQILFCDLRLRDANELTVQAVYPDKETFKRLKDGRRGTNLNGSQTELGITGKAFLDGKTIYASDVTKNSNYVMASDQVRAELAVPIRLRRHVIGVLNVEHTEIDPFTSDDIEMLEAIASQIASVLMRMRQQAQREAFHQVSREISHAVTKPRETPDLLQSIIEVMKPVKGTKINLVTLHDVNASVIDLKYLYPQCWVDTLGFDNVGKRFLLSSMPNARIGVTGRCAKTGESQIVNDVLDDPDYIALNPETRSEMAVPMRYRGDLIAVLAVQSEQINAFAREDREVLETFAELAVIAWQNTEQYRELTNTQRRVEGATALALLNMISGVYQHINKTRAITVRDRLELLTQDYQSGDGNLDDHIAVMRETVQRIISQPLTSNVTDADSAELHQLSTLLKNYFGAPETPKELGKVQSRLTCADDSNLFVRGHSEWFLQLFELIARNCKHALEKTTPNPQLHVNLQINADQQQFELTFHDNGPGFPETVLQQILVTPITKRAGENGSGVGLLMVKLVVECYGGSIQAYNSDDGGALIKIQLPTEPNLSP